MLPHQPNNNSQATLARLVLLRFARESGLPNYASTVLLSLSAPFSCTTSAQGPKGSAPSKSIEFEDLIQPNHSRMSTSSGSYSKLQPKFQDCLLKDTEPPSYIFVWIKIISGIISNINNALDEGGWELESLLDNYLDCAATQPALMPSFLQDEALLIDHEEVSMTCRARGEVSLGSGNTGGPDSAASEQGSSRTESVANAEAADRLEMTIGTAADSLTPEVRAELETIKEQLRRPVGRVPAPPPSPSPSPSSIRGNRGCFGRPL